MKVSELRDEREVYIRVGVNGSTILVPVKECWNEDLPNVGGAVVLDIGMFYSAAKITTP